MPVKLLFVPVSGPGGAGEYFRSLAVARGIERRWPGVEIRFVLSRDANYAGDAPYPVILLDRSPTYCTEEMIRVLDEQRPALVVFDSSGRVAQYAHAQRIGAKVVFVSSRATTRWKGFRVRRLRRFDQHWIAQPRFLGGGLTAGERFKRQFAPGVEVLFLEVLHEPVDTVGTARLQNSLGLRPGQYLLACPGGGGVFSDRPDSARVYYEAALSAARQTGMPVLAVLGTRFEVPQPASAEVRVLASLPNAQLMGMLRDACVGIVNGGSLLLQALAQCTPCVAAAIADDQPDRIERCAALGLVQPSALEASALAGHAVALARDASRRSALRSALERLNLENGVEVAADAAGRLLGLSSAGAQPAQRLRIMHVILSRGFAGSERATAEICNALCLAHDVALVVRRDHRRPSGASILDHLDRRVQVFEVPGSFGRRELQRAIEAWAPDVVHTHLRRGTRYVSRIAPAAAHVCSLHLSINGPHFLHADALLCISEWQLATVPADYRGRVHLVPNSLVRAERLTPERRNHLRAELGAAAGDYLIGGMGRLTHSKGFDVLIRAFERAGMPDARLAIVGEGRELAALARIAGPRVRLAGYRADAKDCFQAFDLFVSSSRSEPFGRVIIEALDAGVHVIASDADGPRDIAQRYPIELVPREDVAALAESMRRSVQRRLAPPSLDLSEFAIERVTAKLLDAYREVIALRRD